MLQHQFPEDFLLILWRKYNHALNNSNLYARIRFIISKQTNTLVAEQQQQN